MTSRNLTSQLLVCVLLAACQIVLFAAPATQGKAGQAAPAGGAALATAKPGRLATQPIDEEYTKKIKEYTTETFFLSPVIDYMPASKTVPTPKAILGDIAGAPGKLPYSKEVHDYMRLLAKSSPRVKVYTIGTTEEGREMIAVAVASEALMAKLDQNKADLAKLADPRTIKMDDAVADAIAQRAAPVYYITGAIHANEAGAPTALMELAYRLAVDDSPYIRNIREHIITLITPVVEPDGRDRMVDVYEWRKKHPNDTPPSAVYSGHYVGHDNNRDAMGLTLELSRTVLNTYLGWKAQVLHDLHESGSFLYDNTVGNGPYNAWLDPILTNEWQLIGWNNVNEMTRMGMPGVFAWGTFDTWSPGYLMFIAALHNGISRLYETLRQRRQRRHRGADAVGQRDVAHVVPAEPADLPRAVVAAQQQQLRADRHHRLAQLLRQQPRLLPAQLLRQEQALGAEAEGRRPGGLRAAGERPAARRAGRAAARAAAAGRGDLAGDRGVHRHDAGAAGGGRGGRGGRGGQQGRTMRQAAAASPGAPARDRRRRPHGRRAGEKPAPVTREFPAGSYIVRMDQPYSRIADALLDYQYWAPNDPQTRPYDDTGWTFPEGFGVQSVRITDMKVLDAPMELVTGDVKAPSGVTGQGPVFAINHTGDNSLITLRYALKDADIQMAEEPFEAGGAKFNRGTFLIKGVAQADLDAQLTALGLKAVALAAAPTVKTHPARAARVAILHQWASTQTEGWWRQAFDLYGVPYDYIDPETMRKTPNLRAKWDVIIFGPGGGQGAVEGNADVAEPDPVEQDGDAEHRHLGADRRHAHRHGARGAHRTCASSSRRAACSSGRTAPPSSPSPTTSRTASAPAPRGTHDARGRIAAADEARGRGEPDRLRRARQPGDVQQQRVVLHRLVQLGRRRRRGAVVAPSPAATAGRRAGRAGRPAAAGGRPAAARRTTRTRCRGGRCTKART